MGGGGPPAAREGLRSVSFAALATGGLGSIVLFLIAANRKGSPPLVQVLFILWVAAPFVALAVALGLSRRQSRAIRATLSGATLILAAVCLGSYGVVALGPPRPKPAVAFVLVPPVSTALAALAVSIAAVAGRRSARRQRA